MKFYALRITCQSCGSDFLVGGSGVGDLSQWRKLTVECRRCSAETPASDAQTVDLDAQPFFRPAGRPAARIPHA
jgi:hypothetical protein